MTTGFLIPAAGTALFACAFAACSDDGTAVGPITNEDGSADGNLGTDAGHDVVSNDSGNGTDANDGGAPSDSGDSGNNGDSAADAAPVVTETVGNGGWVQIFPSYLLAGFYFDDEIVHVSTAPECVLRVRYASKQYATVAEIDLGGDYFGQDGGPPSGVRKILPGSDNSFFDYIGQATPYYPPTGDLGLQLSTTGSSFQSIPVTNLHTPNFPIVPDAGASVQFTAPPVPDGGALSVPHDAPLTIQWTVPQADAGLAGQRVPVTLYQLTGSNGRVGEVYCGYPLSAGQGTIPAEVLTELYNRLGGQPVGGGALAASVGDQKELVQGNDYSFSITVSSDVVFLAGDPQLGMSADLN
jgi:hypothetical protein